MLVRAHPQFLLAVDDRARFKQNGGHAGVFEDDQLVVAVDACLRVDQQPLAIAHDPLDVVGRVLQSALAQMTAEQPGKQQAAGTVAVVLGDENGMAAEAVAEVAFLALEVPFFQELAGDGIVMDRQEEIGSECVGALDALLQSLPRRTFGDQEHAARESGCKQLLLDALGKFQIESILRDAARASRARHLFRVPDIDEHAECRAPAGIGGPGFGTRRLRNGKDQCSRTEQPQNARKHDRDPPTVPGHIIYQFDGGRCSPDCRGAGRARL